MNTTFCTLKKSEKEDWLVLNAEDTLKILKIG